jgi:ABC-type transport system involved in multi-copper enzyme maturation permease subunit
MNEEPASIGPVELPGPASSLSPGRVAGEEGGAVWAAWLYVLWLSLRRQARARQMVWIALGLLLVTVVVIGLNTARGRWGMSHWRFPRRVGPTYQELIDAGRTDLRRAALTDPAATAMDHAVWGSFQAVLDRSGFFVFSRWVVFSVYLSFLLPVFSLSFATEALGGEREDGSLIWLLTRPLPRPAIYLAKYLALLPWSLGLNVGGFGLMCLAAGRPGWLAFQLYWPAILAATFAFCALFHLMGACFRRSAVIAIGYSFFLETILGNLPGYMKRVSISFYTRCIMFDAAADHGMQAEKPSIYLPVDAGTAWLVLLGLTVFLLALGMFAFSRLEYRDAS